VADADELGTFNDGLNAPDKFVVCGADRNEELGGLVDAIGSPSVTF
jgi:hypothetical protein